MRWQQEEVTSVTGTPWLQHEGAWFHPGPREQKSHRPMASSLTSLSVCWSREGGAEGQGSGPLCPPGSGRAVAAVPQDWGWVGDRAGGLQK